MENRSNGQGVFESPAFDEDGGIYSGRNSGGRFPGADLFDTLRQGWQVDELAATIGQESQSRVALVGLSGAGKRLLYRRLCGWGVPEPEEMPRAEGEPHIEPLGLFVLADLPAAAGNGGALGQLLHTPDALLVTLGEPALIVFLLNAERGVTQADFRWIAALRTMGRPIVLALNKCDLLDEGQAGTWPTPQAAAQNAAQRLGMPVIPISARSGLNVEEKLLPAMLSAAPRLAAPLGREITRLRRNAARKITRQAVLFAGLLGLQPLPGLELPFLALMQVGVVLRIGAAYGYQPAGGFSREVIAAIGAMMLFHYLAQTAAKFVPLVGSIVGGLLSGLATFVIGETAIRYYEAEATASFATAPIAAAGRAMRHKLSPRRLWAHRRGHPVAAEDAPSTVAEPE